MKSHHAQTETDRPIPFLLTPAERDTAKLIALTLERARRDANARDQATRERREILELESALEAL